MSVQSITKYCTGCRTCEQLCSQGAIRMISDKEGFLTANINNEKCIECGLCLKRCPQNVMVEKNTPLQSLAVRDKNIEELYNSASGGAFVVAARKILEHGGVVIGAAYNDDMSVSHIIVDQLENLQKLQSSKYVQSNTEHTYSQVKELLKNNRLVLYSGTPCQISGLKLFLKKQYDNLYTMDLICHGVPSPKLFAKYIDWMGQKMNGRIITYNFRDKSCGWGLDYMTKTKTKTKTNPTSLDPYYYHFLKGTTYRECCYNCNYCQKERVSDITIGDYWGIEKEHPHFYSPNGVSCLLINTEKGRKLWNLVSNDFFSLESSFDKIAKYNHNLIYPTKRKSLRDTIYQHIDEMDCGDFFSTQLKIPFNLKTRIKKIFPKWIKILIKKYR